MLRLQHQFGSIRFYLTYSEFASRLHRRKGGGIGVIRTTRYASPDKQQAEKRPNIEKVFHNLK